MKRSRREQLAAFVSGDLSPEEQNRVAAQLAHDTESAEYVRLLRADAERLRSSRRHSAPCNFADRWSVPVPRVHAVRASQPIWPVAMAAAVLVAIGLTLIAVVSGSPDQDRSSPRFAAVIPTDPKLSSADRIDEPQPKPLPPFTDRSIDLHRPTTVPAAPKTLDRPPEATTVPVLTAPPVDHRSPLQVEMPRLSLPMAYAELTTMPGRHRFAAELKRGTVHRVELFVTDLPAVLARFRPVCQTEKIDLFADPVLFVWSKSPGFVGPVGGFCRSLDADGFAQLLVQLGRGSELISHVVITDWSDSDRRELNQLFGADPSAEPSPPDPRRPLSDHTADFLEKALTRPARSLQHGRPLALLAFSAGKGPPSPTAREFLAARVVGNPDHPVVYLVIRRK